MACHAPESAGLRLSGVSDIMTKTGAEIFHVYHM